MENLNEYHLLDIFFFLDGKSLKTCSEVNSKWASIIGSSSCLMKKLVLTNGITSDHFQIRELNRKETLRELASLKRSYHTAIFEDTYITRNIDIALKKQYSHIKKMVFIDIQMTTAALKKILSSSKVIEELYLVGCITKTKKKNILAVPVDSLKSLIFVNSEMEMLMLFGETGLKTFKFQQERFKSFNKKILTTFLNQQSYLETFAIRFWEFEQNKMFECEELQESLFRIKNFSFTSYDDVLKMFDHNVILFLERHKDTLEFFETQSTLPNAVFEYIMKNLKLKAMLIPGNRFPNEAALCSAIRPNHHLKKLIFSNVLDNLNTIVGLASVYKNIEELRFESYDREISKEIMQAISEFPKLRVLRVPYISDDVSDVYIPTLRVLHIDTVFIASSFRTFTARQRNLEELAIELTTSDINEALEEISKNLSNLKKIKLGLYFRLTVNFVHAFLNNCPDLRQLYLMKSNESVSDDVLKAVNESSLRVYLLDAKNRDPNMLKKEYKSTWDNNLISSLNDSLDIFVSHSDNSDDDWVNPFIVWNNVHDDSFDDDDLLDDYVYEHYMDSD